MRMGQKLWIFCYWPIFEHVRFFSYLDLNIWPIPFPQANLDLIHLMNEMLNIFHNNKCFEKSLMQHTSVFTNRTENPLV